MQFNPNISSIQFQMPLLRIEDAGASSSGAAGQEEISESSSQVVLPPCREDQFLQHLNALNNFGRGALYRLCDTSDELRDSVDQFLAHVDRINMGGISERECVTETSMLQLEEELIDILLSLPLAQYLEITSDNEKLASFFRVVDLLRTLQSPEAPLSAVILAVFSL